MPGFCTGSPPHTLIMHFQRTTGSDWKCQTLIQSHNLWCSSRLRLPCHAYLSLLITNPYVNYYCRKHPKLICTWFWTCQPELCWSPCLLLFSRCYKGELPVINASFAFSLPQTADLFMAVSNSLSTANISNLSVQNKVEVYVIYLKIKIICLSPIKCF